MSKLRRNLPRIGLAVVLITGYWVVGWFLRPFGSSMVIQRVPLLVFALGVLFAPRAVAGLLRLGYAVFILLAVLIFERLLPYYYLGNYLTILVLVWVGGQIILVMAGERVRSGEGGGIATSLCANGYLRTLRRMDGGAFGVRLASLLTVTRWSALIFVGSLLLYRSETFHRPEEDLLLQPGSRYEIDSRSHSVVATLTTTDNNVTGYLRTAIEMNDLFRKAGAAVVCFPCRGALDPKAQKLADSLEMAGGVLFVQPRYDLRWFERTWGWNFMRFVSIDVTWQYGKPLIHPGLVAASRLMGTRVHVPNELLRAPSYGLHDSQMPRARNTELRIGEQRIPVWEDGYSVVLGRLSSGVFNPDAPGSRSGWNSFVFPAAFERMNWDSSLTFFDFETVSRPRTLPHAVWKMAAGKMIFVQWVNMGEDFRRDDATSPALVADMVVRGLVIDQARPWHIAISCGILLVAAALFVYGRKWLLAFILIGCAIGCIVLDGWIFREYLLVVRFIYPAFTAAVAAVVLPLVMMAKK